MNEIIVQSRWLRRPMVAFIVIAWTVAAAALLFQYASGSGFDVREFLGALPLALLLAYGSLAFVLNKTELRASAGCIEVRSGPVPVGLPRRTYDLDEIESCYYRKSVVPLKTGSANVFAAGIRVPSGRWVDLIADLETLEEAKGMAERIAAQVSKETGRNMQAQSANGYPPPVDWRERRGLLIWSGAFILALLWILVADTL